MTSQVINEIPAEIRDLLDKSAWLEHHGIIYGDGDWPEGTRLSVCWQDADGGPLGYAFVDIDDAEAAWKIIERRSIRGCNVFIGVGGFPSHGVHKRGSAKDVVGLPAVFLDVDADWGKHAAKTLPTRAQCVALIAAAPFEPTLIIETGGGYHVYGALSELANPNDEAGATASMLRRLKAWLADHGQSGGFHVDDNIVTDGARLLRPAGALNYKYDPPRPVTIQHADPMAVTSMVELQDRLPALPERRAHAVSIGRQAGGQSHSAPPNSDSGDDGQRPGTRFARQCPISVLLETVFGMDADDEDDEGYVSWSYDQGNGPDRRGTTWTGEDGAQVFTIFSETLKAAWHIPDDVDDAWTINSWQLLGHVLCGRQTDSGWVPDFGLAAAVLRAYSTADGDYSDLVDALVELVNVDVTRAVEASALHEAAEMHRARGLPAIGDLIATGTRGEVMLEGGLVCKYGPGTSAHGIFQRRHETDDDGNRTTKDERITDYLVWRPREVAELATTGNGTVELTSNKPLEASSYDVEIIDSMGRRYRRAGFSAVDSTRIDRVIDALNPGVMVPASVYAERTIGNAIRVLGRHDSQEHDHTYTASGWAYPLDSPENIVYLAPAGSVTATGPTDRYALTAAPGSHANALGTAQRAFGFPTLPDSMERRRELAGAFASFFDVFPSDPHIPTGLLGAVFAAPLHMSRRTTLVLVPPPQVGKSLIADITQAWVAATDIGAADFPIGVANSTSVGAEVTQAWYRDALIIADDFRLSATNTADNARSTNIYRSFVQGNYGDAAAVKGTQEGGSRRPRQSQAVGIITAETAPTEEAILTRGVIVELDNTQFPTQRPAPVDAFIEAFGRTGMARELMGDYIRWLAGRIDAHPDGLVGLRREADGLREHVLADYTDKGRAHENTSMLAIGWHFARLWAYDRGLADLLPSETTIEAALSELVDKTLAATTDRGPGTVIMTQIRDMIESGHGHLVRYDGGTPLDSVAVGWALGTHNIEPVNPRLRMGYISRDGHYIHITNDAVNVAKDRAGLVGLRSEQAKEALADFVVAGSNPGNRAHAFVGLDVGNVRGYTFTLEALGIDLPKQHGHDASRGDDADHNEY